MAVSQFRSKRKSTGGRYIAYRKKKSSDLGREATLTRVGETRSRTLRVKGGSQKRFLLSVDDVNVNDNGKIKKVKIKSVLENGANRHFVRRNILTKGAIIDTDLGKAKVTNKPGQEKFVNAVLIKE